MTTGHSKVGASSMYRWSNCPGSVALCATVPNVSSKYADEGTAAHEYAAQCLRNGWGVWNHSDADLADADMVDAVGVYLDEVRGRMTPGAVLLVEHGFHLKQIHEACYGTADAVVWQPNIKHLHCFDYKHGAGIPVEVTGNPQLRYYALGALLTCGFNAQYVTVTIVQPRCPHPDGPVRSETFEAYDLLEWAADLREAVLRTEEPNARLVPGNHCRFCPAAAICPALSERALAVAQSEFSPSQLAPADGATDLVPYDPAKLKAALDARPLLKAFITAVTEFAYREAMAGRLPPEVGHKLVEKRAERQWSEPSEIGGHLLALDLGTNEIFEPLTVKSPAQVEKAIGKKAFAVIEKDHVVKRSSGYTLAPEADKRPAVRVLDAASEFASVSVESEVSVDE
jgi:hypothetical protein